MYTGASVRPPDKLRATLEEMKRKVEEEREAAETLTRTLTLRRDQRGQRVATIAPRPTRTATGVSTGRVEQELAAVRKQLEEQSATTERWIQQLTKERDAGRARMAEAETCVRRLRDELATANSQLAEQKEAAEHLIQQLLAEKGVSVVESPEEGLDLR